MHTDLIQTSSLRLGNLHPYSSSGNTLHRSLYRDTLLIKLTKNLEKGFEGVSLSNPVRGRTILLKSQNRSEGITMFISQESSRRNWTVKILHGEFTKY